MTNNKKDKSDEISGNRGGQKISSVGLDETASLSISVASPIIAEMVSTIPYYGPYLAMAINSVATVGGHFFSKRLERLRDSIDQEASLIDKTKIDESYFESEGFLDNLMRTIENTLKTRDLTKIRLYARILVRLPLLNYAAFRSTSEDFLLILLELSPADLQLAREFFTQQQNLPEDLEDELKAVKDSGYDRLREITNMSKEDYTLSEIKLVRAGLLRQVIGTYISYKGDAYRITPVFKKLMKLIDKLD